MSIGFKPNPAAVIAVVTGLCVLIALSVFLNYLSGTISSLEVISEKLKEGRPDELHMRGNAAIESLLDAIRQFSADSVQETRDMEKKTAEYKLELQLLTKEKENTEAIIYSIRDAVIVSDEYDRLVMANAAAEELFGFKKDPDVSISLEEFIDDNDFIELVRQNRQSRQCHVKHEVTFDGDQHQRTFDCIISCMKDNENQVSGVVAVLHDITREKEISRMKNDFVSHVSHELKTPLASINAYAEMLVDGEAEDQETITEFCTIIQSQAQRLNRLIEEILNISRIESGLVKVNKECLSVAIVVQEAVKMIESYAAEKNITVNLPAPIIHDQVNADKDMLSQVVINLLSNAVKYTEPGGNIKVDSEVNESDKIVHVTVTDTGVGIPPEDIEHVFDKFYRVEANKKYAKGTGLGLNLVQQIVETVHDGKVFVTSTIGEGSTFGFDMPLATSQVEETVK
ncbi:MAG: PAS domain-containing protein [Planctomycetes bacterium]|nr:PAS domain-containing protein [Planctomycetota bacterium]